MKNNDVILSVEKLHKVYKGLGHEVHAIKNVSFQLYKGELLVIMGTSGSGKSTLLNILGALDKPDKGKVILQGTVMEEMFSEPHASKYRRDYIGFVFQSYHLLKDLTVEENIALPLILKGIKDDQLNEKVSRMIDLVGLSECRTHRPIQLSGGQQQRVAIARALITSPPIVLADEPTGNLDYNTTSEILNILVDMKNRLDVSIIMVTHDPMVATYADRVLFFHDGQIIDQYNCSKDQNDMDVILQKFKKSMEKSL